MKKYKYLSVLKPDEIAKVDHLLIWWHAENRCLLRFTISLLSVNKQAKGSFHLIKYS